MTAVTPSTPSVQSSTKSFLAIQQQQRDVQTQPKVKRSLLQIQAEERDKQAEADFLKWWAAEEERLRLESMSTGAGAGGERSGTGGARGQDRKRGGNPRKKKGQTKEKEKDSTKDSHLGPSNRTGQNKNVKREPS